jgi:hypothetical protein
MSLWTRIKFAFVAFFTILFKGRLPEALEPVRRPETPKQRITQEPAGNQQAPAQSIAADTPDRAVQMLSLLQREGRFVDFVLEDLAAYSDAQIGTAVRDVHAGCRRALDRYITLQAIISGGEGDVVTVGQEQALDLASFHLVGNVTGQPPFRGTLLHSGWRVSQVQLPPLPPPGTSGRSIVAPAQIEVA